MLKRIREFFGRRESEPASTLAPTERSRGEVDTAGRPPVHRGPAVVHMPIPQQDLDPDAVKIVQRLSRFDHTAYLVGGCVRDLLLDRHPKDFDIATSATPRQIKRAFRNCRIIGRRFRLAHLYFSNGKIIEVATFRARDGDGDELADGGTDLLIRDDNVFGTPEEDALRRDFTINQLFYDVDAGNVLDHADGLGDLRRKVVRTIGDPEIRFREDPIRILRAIKFAARLGFRIEDRTLVALQHTAREIPKAAPPRVLEELNRYCRGAAGRASFELLWETGVFAVVLPELEKPYEEDDGARSMLLRLLDALDRRRLADQEVSTGEIFAALLIPALRDALRWTADGRAELPRRGDMRQEIGSLLQPLASRLRVSRRDQERCRQIIATLHRMVPARGLRRGLRAAIARRASFADAMVFMEPLADHLGGEFAEALDAWRSAAPAGRGRTAETARDDRPSEAGDGTENRRRRRRRRSRRGGSDEEAPTARRVEPPAGADEAPRAPAAGGGGRKRSPAARGERKPKKWDDDYFFAALPTVPDLEPEPPREETPEEASTPPRQKRSRRRGRRRGGSSQKES